MKILQALIAVCALSVSAVAEEKPVHLFILTGQSNMAGMKPEAGFLPEAKTLFADADVQFVKVAKGGRPIRDWVAEWNDIAKKHNITVQSAGTPFYQEILAKMKPLMDAHPKAASVTFCWMQGENDARFKLQDAYAEALKQLISNLRRDLKRPDMKVVIARISDYGAADDEAWQAVRKALVAVAEQDGQGAWVDCDDLNDKDKGGKKIDDLHYTADGYKLLGQRYARQAKALVDGKAPAKDGRP